MQHAPTVRLDNSKMVREIAKDTYTASIGSEKAVQDGFTGVMEKLSDSHRVRGSCNFTDSGICRGQVVLRVLYAGQDQDQGIPQVGGVDSDPESGHAVTGDESSNFRAHS